MCVNYFSVVNWAKQNLTQFVQSYPTVLGHPVLLPMGLQFVNGHQARNFWNRKKPEQEVCKESTEGGVSKPQQDASVIIPDSWPQPKVVVVGAGMAGLSAAHRLVQGGLCDVTILEATDRPGGRIQSCWFTNGVAELGASFIQGACAANSAYNLAVMERLLQSPVVRMSANKGVFYSSQGKPIDPIVAHKAFISFRQIESIAFSLHGKKLCIEDTDMEAFMTSHIRRELMNFPEAERHEALMVMNAYLNDIKQKVGASLECVNTKYYGSLSHLPGGNVKIPFGFVGVLAPLVRDIPDCTIKYCKPVKTINWDVCETEKPRACVHCATGESFPADYVIVTTPLGFLKDKAQSFFVPHLPAKKTDAINRLGFGHLNKLFIQFREQLWLKDEGNIRFAWDPNDYLKTESWLRALTSLEIDEKSGCVLSGVVTGKDAIKIETLSADQIMDDITNHMKCFLGNFSIPKPSSILRSKWSTNIYYQGSFTFISTESGPDHIKDLAEPTPEPCAATPVLFFAGEHTSVHHYSTVHGARDSGIREANKILNYTKEYKGAPSRS